jgi:Arc/MetJ-type ribon-helix-helix transcriptional regulator
MKPTPIRIGDDALAGIDALVGKYGRAKFIREAITEKLERAAAVEAELTRRERK